MRHLRDRSSIRTTRSKLITVTSSTADTDAGRRADRTARVVIADHALVQNLRRAHYDLGVDARRALRVAAAFTGLAEAI